MFSARSDRLLLFGLALLVGCGAGLGAVAFRHMISGLTELFSGHVDYSAAGHAANPHVEGLGRYFVILAPVVGRADLRAARPVLRPGGPRPRRPRGDARRRPQRRPDPAAGRSRQGGRERGLHRWRRLGRSGGTDRADRVRARFERSGSSRSSTSAPSGCWSRAAPPAVSRPRSTRRSPGCSSRWSSSCAAGPPTRSGWSCVSSVTASVIGRAMLGNHPFLTLPAFQVEHVVQYPLFAVLALIAGRRRRRLLPRPVRGGGRLRLGVARPRMGPARQSAGSCSACCSCCSPRCTASDTRSSATPSPATTRSCSCSPCWSGSSPRAPSPSGSAGPAACSRPACSAARCSAPRSATASTRSSPRTGGSVGAYAARRDGRSVRRRRPRPDHRRRHHVRAHRRVHDHPAAHARRRPRDRHLQRHLDRHRLHPQAAPPRHRHRRTRRRHPPPPADHHSSWSTRPPRYTRTPTSPPSPGCSPDRTDTTLPVIDDDGRYLGTLNSHDVLDALAAANPTDVVALTIDTAPVGETASFGDVLRRFDRGADAIPVADEAGALIGWVRQRDVLAVLAPTGPARLPLPASTSPAAAGGGRPERVNRHASSRQGS